MKQCNLTKGIVVFLTIMITLFCGVMPSSGAQPGDVPNCDYCCEGLNVEGCYGMSHEGMMITPNTGPKPVPMASVGVLCLVEDTENPGTGFITGHEMVSCGNISFPAEISGTYEVYDDCTGTAWVCVTQEGMTVGIESEIAFVISKGEEIQMVTTKMNTPCITLKNLPQGNIVPINIVGTAKICDD